MMIVKMKKPCSVVQNTIKCDRHRMVLARNGNQVTTRWVDFAMMKTQMRKKV